ncbi:SAM-dependent methyltransferase [Limobrevibacterium gyesilva]|uniref:Cyclopropane-fatty-acyl-phospholipid synthase family protein n=1 Tax=Limobrevibacterium gyesilva TaxID=2991712 RepID=A0AA42CD43_9PROT|nr:cyclopropane-fatty-acyl-phospholipid synthase family protein [Limobrevibacterium gyesilva]MCW3474408.1 cyclopropane-fatty-acyl-phospholipid synthase family protein [Limobrevibacterium gyesilva]
MSATEAISEPSASPPRDRRLRSALHLAGLIRTGTLTVVMPDGSSHRVAATESPAATVVLKHPRAIRRLLARGSLGLAEAYVDGLWDSPDLRGVMAVAVANAAEWEPVLRGHPWARRISHALHTLRPPSGGSARRNIVESYDLGNDFYAAWLDPTMTFSAAYFGGSGVTLEAAQLRKIHRLCQLLRLRPGMRLLEIGCGWGSFAEVAARDYGASVLGITLSPTQLAYAQRRIAQAGLSHRVELRLQDCRDVTGSFDRIASIEMFEATGDRFWPDYCGVIRDRLRKNGVAGLQVITIADPLFDQYRQGTDFVQRHIFPGSMLPSKRRLRQAIGRAGLAWGQEFWFGRDYAETLSHWQDAFQAAWPRIVATTSLNRRPCDERFKRLWEYHLAYCETGFRAGWADVGQILIAPNA